MSKFNVFTGEMTLTMMKIGAEEAAARGEGGGERENGEGEKSSNTSNQEEVMGGCQG